MSDSGRAAAWLVLSSVAKGVGLGDCAFHSTPDTSFLWRPALDGLNENQILILNRVVTKNYRDAERSGVLSSQTSIRLRDRWWLCSLHHQENGIAAK